MKLHKPTLLLAEMRESFTMAMNALAAHKLRSALTLLGVLIGVFSIIVVMTAMRVLKQNIESANSSPVGQPDVRDSKMAGDPVRQQFRLGKILAAETHFAHARTARRGKRPRRRSSGFAV